MPSTLSDVFAAAGLRPAGVVPWGTPVPEPGPGVYVVALTEGVGTNAGALSKAPVADAALEHLLAVRPELQLDKRRPTVAELRARLEAFWVVDELVVYIGLAGTSVRARVRQYYKTPLGARKPHAGGWWLKTLTVIGELWVHYAPTPASGAAETAMLQRFAGALASGSRARLHDADNPAPFANLRTGRGDNKAHGITGATGEMASLA